MPRAARKVAGPEVSVLRLGHRPGRDPRLTTHVALTARAFGARRLYLEPADPDLAARIADVVAAWGGPFEVVGVSNWRKVVNDFSGPVVHLTMYGLPFEEAIPKLKRAREVLLVVGGAKVPSELYERATWNLAVGHQPHSEVAAVAVLLERLKGVPGPGAWPGARQAIEPQARGKRVNPVASEGSAK